MSCIPPCANCSIDTQNCIRPLDNVCPTVHTTNVGMQSKVGSGVTEHPLPSLLPPFPMHQMVIRFYDYIQRILTYATAT